MFSNVWSRIIMNRRPFGRCGEWCYVICASWNVVVFRQWAVRWCVVQCIDSGGALVQHMPGRVVRQQQRTTTPNHVSHGSHPRVSQKYRHCVRRSRTTILYHGQPRYSRHVDAAAWAGRRVPHGGRAHAPQHHPPHGECRGTALQQPRARVCRRGGCTHTPCLCTHCHRPWAPGGRVCGTRTRD